MTKMPPPERIDVAHPEKDAALGTSALLGRERWVFAGTSWKDKMYLVTYEREAREPAVQPVRPVAEQARVLGLRRARGTADPIWSGTFMEEEDDSH